MNCCVCYEEINFKTSAILLDKNGKVVCECEDSICINCAEKVFPKCCPTCRTKFSSFTTLRKGSQFTTAVPAPAPVAPAPVAPAFVAPEPEDEDSYCVHSGRLFTNEYPRGIELAPPPIRKTGETYKVGDDVLVYVSLSWCRSRGIDDIGSRRAKIIKMNATGFTCKFYDYHTVSRRNGLYWAEYEYYWTNEFEDYKVIVKDMRRVDKNPHENEWIKQHESDYLMR
jgi:hypothetical protein